MTTPAHQDRYGDGRDEVPGVLVVALEGVDVATWERALGEVSRNGARLQRVTTITSACDRLRGGGIDAVLLATRSLDAVPPALDSLRAAANTPVMALIHDQPAPVPGAFGEPDASVVLSAVDTAPHVVARLAAALAQQHRSGRALAERRKELALVADAIDLLGDTSRDLDETLAALAARIPAGFARPDLARARVTIEHGLQHRSASTPGFATARHRLERAIDDGADGRIVIEVAYPDDPAFSRGPFLDEEGHVLDVLAQGLRTHRERRDADARAARLRGELERRHGIQQLLLDLYSRYLSGGVEDVAGAVLDGALRAVPGAEQGSVLLRDRSGHYRFAAVRGYDAAALAETTIPPEHVLFGRDWRDGHAFVVRDVERINRALADERPDLAALIRVTRESRARESLVAPVKVADELVAAVSVEHTSHRYQFDEGDGALLQLFAQGLGALFQRTLAETRADLMERAMDAAGDGIAIVDVFGDDARGDVWHANRAFANLLGVPLEDLAAWLPDDALEPIDARRVTEAVRRVASSGRTMRLTAPIELPGASRFVEASIARLDSEPPHARLAVTLRDVSERVRHTAELERLNADLAARLDETRTLEAIDAAIASGRDSASTLDVVVAQVSRRPGVAAANLLVVDTASGQLRTAAADAAAKRLGLYQRGLSGSDPARRVQRERQPHAGRAELGPPPLRAVAAGSSSASGWGEYRAWPLVIQGDAVGVLEVVLTPGFVPDDAWLRFMGVVVAQTAIAVDHVTMLARLRDSAQAYATLAEFSGAMEEIDDPDDLVDLGVRTLLREFGMDRAAFIDRGDDDMLRARRRWGEIPPAARAIVSRPQPVGIGAIGRAVVSGEAVYVADYRHWPHGEPGLADVGFRSILALPVRSGERVCSVIGLGSYHRTVLLSDDQITIARAFVRRLERALERVTYQHQIVHTREGAFRALGIALEYRDYETKGHTDRVVALARRLGQRVELSPDDLEALVWGAYLHDLGKIAIPDQILLKPGRLTAAEFEQVKRHTVVGFDMSRDLAFLPLATRLVVRSHHERWDGRGYPDGLAGDAIPYLARLFALVDVYDALTSERPYKRAWTPAEAVAELAAQAGAQFDPELTRAMLALLADERARSRSAG